MPHHGQVCGLWDSVHPLCGTLGTELSTSRRGAFGRMVCHEKTAPHTKVGAQRALEAWAWAMSKDGLMAET